MQETTNTDKPKQKSTNPTAGGYTYFEDEKDDSADFKEFDDDASSESNFEYTNPYGK